jgi:hypothetical protein
VGGDTVANRETVKLPRPSPDSAAFATDPDTASTGCAAIGLQNGIKRLCPDGQHGDKGTNTAHATVTTDDTNTNDHELRLQY